MIWLIVIAVIVLVCFGGVLLFGAPYLPTLTPQVHAALELADLKPGQTLLELGCGDGKVLIAAAQVGIYAVGYELNPVMAFIAWARTRRFRKHVKVVWGNFWTKEWPPTDAIFIFLLNRYMTKIDHRIRESSTEPVKLVSFAFRIPGKEISTERSGVFLYEYNQTAVRS
jgi:SAM-dependent methyltransferase